MFGDPETNHMGWDKRKIGELAEIMTGGTPSRANPDYYIGEIPWVKTGEILDSGEFYVLILHKWTFFPTEKSNIRENLDFS
jgi:hypothetical protein